jgi:Secreted protein containing C-terminal beta-propeller domain distantly related to WD-40 repeats
MRKKSYILSILSIIILLSVTGCTFPWQKKKAVTPATNQNPTATTTVDITTGSEQPSGGIKKFKDIQELQAFLIQHASNNGLGGGKMVSDSNTSAVSAPTTSVKEGATASTDYSKTNVQVEGVDEADIMKTDGDYVYLLDYNDLYIIKAKPASSASVITKITFKSRPQEFYISGDRLVIFGYDNQIFNDATYKTFKRQSSYTYVKVFDISDPKSPKQIRDLNLEGNYSDSRMVGDYLYFITNNYQNYLEGEPLLPRVLDGGQVLPEKCGLSAKCYTPNIFYFDIPYQSYNFTSVTAVNVKDASEAISGDIYLLSGNQNLYVSPNNIYITYTEYLNEYDIERDVTVDLVKSRLSADNQAKIAKIEAVDNFILSGDEKKNKIYNLIQAYISSLSDGEQATLQTEIDALLKKTLDAKAKEMEKTVIHKIAFSGSKLEYKAQGQVSGHVLNQFSMDENNNFFRIATTKSQSWSRLESNNKDSYNNVYVLDDKLQTVGMLENLATGEQIYSARFMGDRAYLVTYKQTDPLFAIDLKDPAAPKVLGELKIPGYSTYLHPYANNILLGFGRDTETNSNGTTINKGLKLGLFDVTNPASPKELDSFVTGDQYSDSIALFDHKAFLADSGKNLVSIPAVLRSGAYGDRVEFSGALVFGITNNKIKLRGRIDHSDNGNYTKQDYWSGINYYDNSVKRSLYIGDSLYTFSNKFLKINDLKSTGDNLTLLKTIDLLPNSGKDFEVKPVTTPISVPVVTSSSPGAAPSKIVN